jgi:hypothetical protein
MLRQDVDLLLFVHTNGWPTYGRTREWVKALPVPSVMLTLDLYRGLEREADVELPNFSCRYVFTADEPDWLRERGVNALFSPPGILETSCYVAAPDPLHPAYGKIVFVGSQKYHAAWPWRQELLAFLRSEYGGRFVHFDHSSGMRGHALNVLYASASVTVGDSCFASPDSGYTSDRLFESLGRGATLVYPTIRWESVLGPSLARNMCQYTPGDYGSLREAIDDAICDGPHPDELFAQARFAIGENHSYTQRLQAILETVAQHEPSVAKALKEAR